MGWEMGEVQKGVDICIPMADSCLRFDRKQQNSVKQSSFNKKNIKKIFPPESPNIFSDYINIRGSISYCLHY